jgi:hypothetical protein
VLWVLFDYARSSNRNAIVARRARFAYSGGVEIRVISNDEAFIRSLSGTADPALKADAGPPSFVPGAAESWWQLLVEIGAIGLPLGVAGNLIASWIWKAMHEPAEPRITALNLSKPSKVKLVFSTRNTPIEVEIQSDDLEAIRASVESALRHVDTQQ